jgi:hypothetical protein
MSISPASSPLLGRETKHRRKLMRFICITVLIMHTSAADRFDAQFVFDFAGLSGPAVMSLAPGGVGKRRHPPEQRPNAGGQRFRLDDHWSAIPPEPSVEVHHSPCSTRRTPQWHQGRKRGFKEADPGHAFMLDMVVS